LEFKHCFLVGIEENLFPSQMSMSSEKDIEEERRLFYVALTRAEKTATLSYAETRRHWGKFTNCSPSRFISEIDSSYLDLSEMSGMFMAKQAFVENSENARFNSFKKDIPLSNFKKETPLANFKRVQAPSKFDSSMDTVIVSNLREGMTVEHASFGVGKIDQMDSDRVVINFGSFGTKTLLIKFAKLKVLAS